MARTMIAMSRDQESADSTMRNDQNSKVRLKVSDCMWRGVRTTGMPRERTLLTANVAPLAPKYKILRAKNPYIILLLSRRMPYQAYTGRCETVNVNGIGLLTNHNHGTTRMVLIV